MTAPASLWKILFEDGERRTILMRYEPGAVIPRHRHIGDEQIVVLEGSVSVHTVRSTGGALVLAVMSGGTESVPDGRS